MRNPHPWRRPLIIVAVLAALVALLLTPLNAAADGRHGRQKPTIVLVHGAWADGSSWNAVTARLLRDGYPVRVPPNPLRSLPGDSATIADFLATLRGPVVLVAHSYGGAVITNAATGNANVKALVYVDAFLPDQNEDVLPLAGPDSALAVDPTTVFDFVPYPEAPPGDVDLYLKRDTFLTSFANGVPRPQAELSYAAQRPFTLSAGNQPSGVPAWRSIPSWAVVGTQDRVIPPSAQLFMANRAHARITQVRSGHLSLVTKAAAVTDVVESAARRTT